MRISDVKIFPVDYNIRLAATANVTIGDFVRLQGLRILKNGTQMKVVMPTKTNPGGKKFEVFHPVKKEHHKQLETVILAVYRKMMSGRTEVNGNSINYKSE